ncbi:MAG: hypothetical protein QOJ52_4102 [Acidimicrobiaceae bacterium]|jgi:hypothetical protein|nr:hypothetical protein [Acidimicrobiaceae bacterium]
MPTVDLAWLEIRTIGLPIVPMREFAWVLGEQPGFVRSDSSSDGMTDGWPLTEGEDSGRSHQEMITSTSRSELAKAAVRQLLGDRRVRHLTRNSCRRSVPLPMGQLNNLGSWNS